MLQSFPFEKKKEVRSERDEILRTRDAEAAAAAAPALAAPTREGNGVEDDVFAVLQIKLLVCEHRTSNFTLRHPSCFANG